MIGYPNMHNFIVTHLKIDSNTRETNKCETPEKNIPNGISLKASSMPSLTVITLFPKKRIYCNGIYLFWP